MEKGLEKREEARRAGGSGSGSGKGNGEIESRVIKTGGVTYFLEKNFAARFLNVSAGKVDEDMICTDSMRQKYYCTLLCYVKEIVNLAFKKSLNIGFSSLRYWNIQGKGKTVFNISPGSMVYVQKPIMFELCIKNFIRILNSEIISSKAKAFIEILIKSKRDNHKMLLCRLIQRKFTLMQSAFFIFKQFCLEKGLRKRIVISGKKRAAVTRLYFLMRKNEIFAYNCVKAYRKPAFVTSVRIELAIYDLHYFIESNLKEFAFHTMRFETKMINLVKSGKIKKIIEMIAKCMSKFIITSLEPKFYTWYFNTHSLNTEELDKEENAEI